MDNKEQLDDLVFESLMQEMITGQRPPDLSARILTAARGEARRGSEKVEPILSSTKSRSSGSAIVFKWMIGLAAVLVISVASWQWLSKNDAISDEQASSPKQQNSTPISPELANLPSNSQMDAPPKKANVKLQPETIESLPFELDSQIAKQTNDTTNSDSTVKPVKLSREEIVERLNQQLVAMWQSLDVKPAGTLTAVELAQQISLTLVGNDLSDEELAKVANEKSQSIDTKKLVESIRQSDNFRQTLSARIVQQWTGRSPSAADTQLAQSLSARMREGLGWNEIVEEMIGGSLDSEDSVSNQFLSIFSGGENHRLIECVGREFLNEQIACMRCHRHPEREIAIDNQQASYWSMVAMLKGIEGHGPGQLVVDKQQELFANQSDKPEPSVYYELPSGALKQAYAALPDGQSWQAGGQPLPRRALASWLKDSTLLDQATVNSVWQIFFGRPLSPRNTNVDAVALEHRHEMLVFLSQQFDLADHDLGQLADWIVSSRAFSIRANNLTRDQWQEMEQSQIDQWQLADWTFATGARLQLDPSRKRLQNNLNYVLKWRSDKRPQPILSQPSPDLLKPIRISEQLKSQRPTFSSSFAVHGLRHTIAEESFVDQLLKSEKLTWQERIQHVVGVANGVGSISDDIQMQSKELLQYHSGDARAALLDLLWASQSSDLLSHLRVTVDVE